jgi:hypothetical protein
MGIDARNTNKHVPFGFSNLKIFDSACLHRRQEFKGAEKIEKSKNKQRK